MLPSLILSLLLAHNCPCDCPHFDTHPSIQPGDEEGVVETVVDGDTIHVLVDGAIRKVRLLHLDAPELSGPRVKRPEPGAGRARDFLASKVLGKHVLLRPDADPPYMDKYGRALRLVLYSETRTTVQDDMISSGWARADGKRLYLLRSHYCELEAEARAAKRGIWSYSRNAKPSQCGP